MWYVLKKKSSSKYQAIYKIYNIRETFFFLSYYVPGTDPGPGDTWRNK